MTDSDPVASRGSATRGISFLLGLMVTLAGLLAGSYLIASAPDAAIRGPAAQAGGNN